MPGEYPDFEIIADESIYKNNNIEIDSDLSSGLYKINLSTEKLILPPNFTYQAYSTNKGVKWVANKTFTENDFKKFLNKGGQLVFAQQYNSKTKRPAEDSLIILFPAITKRPPAPKLVVHYGIGAETDDARADMWVLVQSQNSKNATEADYNISIYYSELLAKYTGRL